jgi:hypothetical protein
MTLNQLPDYFRGIADWFVEMVDLLYSGNFGELTIGQGLFIAIYIWIVAYAMYDDSTSGDSFAGMFWGPGIAIPALIGVFYLT